MSGTETGDDYDLTAVTDGGDAAMPHGGELNAFVEAILGRDPEAIAMTRTAVVDAMGEAAMVDAAATIAAFNAYPRAADATGIPLEDAKREVTAGLRQELGLDALEVAA